MVVVVDYRITHGNARQLQYLGLSSILSFLFLAYIYLRLELPGLSAVSVIYSLSLIDDLPQPVNQDTEIPVQALPVY